MRFVDWALWYLVDACQSVVHWVEPLQETCFPYWPMEKDTTLTFGKLKVKLLSEKPCGDFIIRKLELGEDTPHYQVPVSHSSLIILTVLAIQTLIISFLTSTPHITWEWGRVVLSFWIIDFPYCRKNYVIDLWNLLLNCDERYCSNVWCLFCHQPCTNL